jgi:hypothetical protein
MITAHDHVILDALYEAIERVKAGIDLEKAKEVCKARLGNAAVDAIEIKDASIAVHEGQQALKVKMRVSCDLDMLVDFHGNCISTFQENVDPGSSPEGRLEEAGYQAAQSHQQF